MCFLVQVEVVLQRDVPATRAALELPEASPWRFAGSCPTWQLVKGGCSCGLVTGDGAAIALDPAVLRALLRDRLVKRLHVIWFWTHEPDEPPVVRLDIEEFELKNAAQTLAQDTLYRITDASKYAWT